MTDKTITKLRDILSTFSEQPSSKSSTVTTLSYKRDWIKNARIILSQRVDDYNESTISQTHSIAWLDCEGLREYGKIRILDFGRSFWLIIKHSANSKISRKVSFKDLFSKIVVIHFLKSFTLYTDQISTRISARLNQGTTFLSLKTPFEVRSKIWWMLVCKAIDHPVEPNQKLEVVDDSQFLVVQILIRSCSPRSESSSVYEAFGCFKLSNSEVSQDS